MKITSHPNGQPNRSERIVSDCGRSLECLLDRVRFEEPSDENCHEKPVIVFRCHGTPETIHNFNTQYRFSVELEPEELLAGLATMSPALIGVAIGKMLAEVPALKTYAEGFEEIDRFRDWASITPNGVVSAANAVTSGVVNYLEKKQNTKISNGV